MKKISYKKGWGTDTNPAHVEPPPVPLIKETSTGKSDEGCVKLNYVEILHILRRTFISLGYLCLNVVSWKSFYC